MTHKTKATWGGRQFGNTKHKHGNDSLYQAGGQCYQSVSVRCHNCEALSFDEYSLRYFSRAKEHGANRSDSCSFFLRRLFRAGDVFSVDSSLVIVCAGVPHTTALIVIILILWPCDAGGV